MDSGNSNMSEELELELIEVIQKGISPMMSKAEVANYLNVSSTTVDNYVKKGKIPKGQKRQGVLGLQWNKYDLDKILNK